MMPFELGAEVHLFTTFTTCISAILFLIMGSLMRVGIALVFVFITAFVTMIPTAFSVGSDVMI